MSVIFGLFHRNGKPAESSDLEAMMHAYGSWECDHQAVWKEGSMGIGIRQCFETEQASSFLTPYKDPENGTIFMIECRLDNRDDLSEKLAISHSERNRIADEKLAFLAYKKWGEECSEHLIGDWSLCVCDPQNRTFFLARDPYGMTSINYYLDDKVFAFSSNKRALLHLPQIPKKPNYTRISQTFAYWKGDMELTAHEGILRLGQAHWLEVSPEKVTKYRYFKLEDTPAVKINSLEEASDQFLHLYQKAVKSALRNPRGYSLSLSSGLDSSSIAALAAEHLESRNEKLKGFCSVPAFDCPSHGDESPLVKELGEMYPNLDIDYVDFKDVNPVEGALNSIEQLAEPFGIAYNCFWFNGFYARAKQKNIGSHLVGSAGNFTISYPGYTRYLSFGDLVEYGQWTQAFYQLLTPYSVRRLKASITGADRKYRALSTDFMSSSLLEKSRFFEKYRERRWILENQIARNGREHRIFLLDPKISAAPHFNSETANALGIDCLDPTMNLPLTQFCINLPEKFYVSPTQNRILIKHAMKGKLPDSILNQRKKNNQALDLFQRLLAYKGEIYERLNQYEQSDAVKAFIRVDHLQKRWNNCIQKSENKIGFQPEMVHFVRGMACAHFIFVFFDKHA